MPQNADELDVDLNIPPEDLLRALPLSETEPDNEALPVPPSPTDGDGQPGADGMSATATFTIKPSDEPQAKGIKFFATDSRTGQEFYVGRIAVFSSRLGLSRRSEASIFDRHKAAERFGEWAHFIWPTAMAESAGQEIVINAWDRAHFTWGFYQLAAHTPDDNLILLMRELVKLGSATTFFPDLALGEDGRLTRKTSSGHVSLETTKTVAVGSGTEEQLVDFMAYLNPSSRRFDQEEAVASARFIAWASEDPEMLATTTRVSIAIMKRKIKGWANTLGLMGKRPELAIWVSDIVHHGRGTKALMRDALAKPTFAAQIEALGRIDKTGDFVERRKTVDAAVDQLVKESRFTNMLFGSGSLAL
ncbi:hypothetical protein [Methylobacterium trifolii]|uniref:Uncharacterized protein n=1 Tax=Methylobacterium trifolii TaxID=1003092 RepID=A0ABQ4U7D7_9HYPH|nr:hypothetical protein [Methylobacterium trifolii]GJE62706.1 hypothetical protein MPOCJGCO_4841 [Methylobacterium trifolii]